MKCFVLFRKTFLATRKAGDKLEIFLGVNLERLTDLPKPY